MAANQLNVNLKLRTDETPFQLLISFLRSPVLLRLLGIVSILEILKMW